MIDISRKPILAVEDPPGTEQFRKATPAELREAARPHADLEAAAEELWSWWSEKKARFKGEPWLPTGAKAIVDAALRADREIDVTFKDLPKHLAPSEHEEFVRKIVLAALGADDEG